MVMIDTSNGSIDRSSSMIEKQKSSTPRPPPPPYVSRPMPPFASVRASSWTCVTPSSDSTWRCASAEILNLAGCVRVCEQRVDCEGGQLDKLTSKLPSFHFRRQPKVIRCFCFNIRPSSFRH